MRWFGWFRGAAFNGGALTNADKGEQVNRPEAGRSQANVTVTDERAMMVSTVFACTRIIAQTCATLPLGFYERTNDGREPLPEDHYLSRLLKYKPNGFMNALELRQSMFVQRVLWGNAYAHIERKGGRIIALTPLKPEYMKVNRKESQLEYHYNTDSGDQVFNQKDIFHLKGFSSDGIVGMSALGYAREALGLTVASDQSAAKSVRGLARAVLELDDYPTQEQKEQLRKMYGEGDSIEFRDSLAIIPGGMKYRGVGIPPDDMQLLESRQFNTTELARFFGVPAVLIDAAGSTAAWPASYEQQMQAFLTFTLKGYLEEFESKVVDSLVEPAERRKIYAEHKVDGLLRADSAGRAAFYSAGLQNGWLTSNEVRVKENLPKSEDAGADQLRAQVNMAPLNDLQGQNDVVQT